MTIANVTKTPDNLTGANPSFTHTPVGGDPRGVLVLITQPFAGRIPSAVTYGGVSMAEVAGSPNEKSTGEAGVVTGWFLGTSIPTGIQTVAITAGSRDRVVSCYTVTADGDMEVQDSDGSISSDSLANPSITLSLGGDDAFCAIGFMSGASAVSGISPTTNWTDDIEDDFGGGVIAIYSYDIISNADVAAGWTQSADDAVAIAVAIKEIGGVGPTGIQIFRRRIEGY